MSFKRLMAVGLVLALFALMLTPTLAQDQSSGSNTGNNQQNNNPTPQPALTPTTEFYVTSLFRVNVRSGPGTEYTVLGKLNLNDRVDITGRSENSDWLRVNFNGQEGWVAASVVDVNGDVASAPVAQAGANAVLRSQANTQSGQQGQNAAAGQGEVVVVTRVNANLRSTPVLTGEKLATIPFNTQLRLEARTENNNWVRVTFNNQTGWISSGLLNFTLGNIETLPFVNAEGQEVQPQNQGQTQGSGS